MTTAHSFTDFAFIAAINGFANAQSSGALATWLDNNYKKTSGIADPDRKIYGFSLLRLLLISRIAMALAFIAGGMLATLVYRESVFFLQSMIFFFLIMVILLVVRDERTETAEDHQAKQNSKAELLKRLSEGFKFYFSSQTAFFFLTGVALFFVTVNIWGKPHSFPTVLRLHGI
ncbi:MAG: hypothetical protein ACFFD4_06690 [Candidatus Odinarchaeota archaeon]